MIRKGYSILCLFFVLSCLSEMVGQNIETEVIIEMDEGVDWNDNFFISRSSEVQYQVQILSRLQNIYLLKSQNPLSEAELLSIKQQRNVVNAFYNSKLTNRVKPSDEKYFEQWSPSFIELEKVWETVTGGKTKDGSDIVIAVLDDGVDVNHEDLNQNIFVNEAEVRFDNIDNDNNGYIDDYRGINGRNGSSEHVIQNHGTWVCSILGAVGDNEIGTAGVNWNVKILPISGITTKSSILMAYDYIYTMKKLYIDSDGERGANILVSNYSGGLDKEFGSNPNNVAWCNFYDLMGSVGILSVGSAANNDDDVELVGDMPATCSSPYLIAVTNVNREKKKASGSAYGAVSIDLAAPGEDIFGAKRNDAYTTMDGTSSSAPHVAGVAALLFSVECSGLQDLLDFDKVGAISYVRDAILNGVVKSDNFEGITVTGGYLNAFGALQEMQEVCDNDLLIASEKGEMAFKTIVNLGVGNVEIEYVTPDETKYTLVWSDVLGRLLLEEEIVPPAYGQKIFYSKFNAHVTGIYNVSLFGNNNQMITKRVFLVGQ